MLHVQKYLLENGIDQLTQELGIEVKQYPEHGIMNLNYSQIDSPKTHPVVIECRGLILSMEKPYTVISRKFDRFFNHGEALDITQAFSGENAILGLKEDGSCIGVYYNPYTGTWNTSTRGSALAEGGFVTEWGPATESPKSPLYEDDGYWRGPIWAPTTLLLWDGLRRQGEVALAREIAEKFCSLAAKNGMAENFDARSGRGLRDRAFAWTSAVYILLSASLSPHQP